MRKGLATGAVRMLRLPTSERRLAVEAALQLTRASLELRLAPRRRVVGLLGTADGDPTEEAVYAERTRQATQVGRMVTRIGDRLPWHPGCLRQALAVQRMLHRRAISSRLHLGVTGTRDASAHAWVTVGGQPVVGARGRERYVPLAAFEARSSR
jgi:hypothetical protein